MSCNLGHRFPIRYKLQKDVCKDCGITRAEATPKKVGLKSDEKKYPLNPSIPYPYYPGGIF